MEKGGWVNRLWLYVAKIKENYVEIYNQSISGGTTEMILERFESEAKIRNADAIIFQVGANDASYEHEPNNFLVQPQKFRENLLEIIRRAKKITDNVAFMDFKNCDESKTMPVSWIDIYYANKNIGRYSKIMEEVCRDNNTPFLDVGSLNNEDFYDGLHPNSEGHRKIFEKVKDFLQEKKWI